MKQSPSIGIGMGGNGIGDSYKLIGNYCKILISAAIAAKFGNQLQTVLFAAA